MTVDERLRLIAEALAGSLSVQDASDLHACCERQPALLDDLVRHTVIERLLQHSHCDTDPTAFVRETEARIRAAIASGEIPRPPGFVDRSRDLQLTLETR